MPHARRRRAAQRAGGGRRRRAHSQSLPRAPRRRPGQIQGARSPSSPTPARGACRELRHPRAAARVPGAHHIATPFRMPQHKNNSAQSYSYRARHSFSGTRRYDDFQQIQAVKRIMTMCEMANLWSFCSTISGETLLTCASRAKRGCVLTCWMEVSERSRGCAFVCTNERDHHQGKES